MFREKIDKARDWRRQLSQPLVSELPRSVIWVSLGYTTLFLTFMLVPLSYVEIGAEDITYNAESLFKIALHALVSLLLISHIFACLGLLFCPASVIERSSFLQKHRNEKIKSFTLWRPLIAIFFAMFIGMNSLMIIPTMQWSQNVAKLDLVLLEKMRDGNVSLEDKWLKANNIPMPQYAMTRQNVINDGWDSTYDTVITEKQNARTIIIIMVLVQCIFIWDALMEVYLAWRYYPRAENTFKR